MRRSSSCSSEKAKFMGSLRVVRMRPPGRWAVTFYRAFRTSARRSVYARVRSLSMEQIGARELRANLAAALRQAGAGERVVRSEEHTSELQSLMRISYAVFCL